MTDLRELFDITEVSLIKKTIRLKFTPKGGNEFAFSEFLADIDKYGRIKYVETLFTNGDSTIVEFHGWDRHRDIRDSKFVPSDDNTFESKDTINKPEFIVE
jgi:hypothetical protein